MHYQIFIPNKSAANPQHLVDVGLADHVEGASFLSSRGPEDLHGVVVSWPTPQEPECGYKPAQQTWIPAIPWGGLEAGRYWVGFWDREAPKQYELARNDQQDGHGVELGNGEAWLVPTIAMLPRELSLNPETMETRWRPVDKFRGIYTSAVEWVKECETGSLDRTDIEVWTLAYRLLNLNYRLTPEVCVALSLLGTHTIEQALCVALCMLPTQIELDKEPIKLSTGT